MTEEPKFEEPKFEGIVWKFKFFLAHRLPTCKELAPIMSQSLERKLSLREKIQLKLHIYTCDWCRYYLKQLYMIRKALQLKAQSEINDETQTTPSLSNDARERLKEKLKQTVKSQ